MQWSEAELQAALKNNPALKVHDNSAAKRKKQSPKAVARVGDDFDSEAERRYYLAYVLPGISSGQIVKMELHKEFEIAPAVTHCGKKYQRRVYTPDFFLTLRDGSVKVVEVKGRKIKKLQRDYPLRRQLFLLQYCVPNNWVFQEIMDDEV